LNTNDLVYKIAARAKDLANQKMPELRYANGTTDTFSGAQRECAHQSRGELIEEILLEEFLEEYPKEIEEDAV
jgi:hypothetical protein